MRTIITGFIVFALWSTLSTYIYVCKIQGLCREPISLLTNDPAPESEIINSLPKYNVKAAAVLPINLLNYFEFDKSEFKVNELTKKYFNESNMYLKQNTNARLIITGHTDAIGTDEYNMNLGYRRAQSARQYFERAGIPAEKISVKSKGEIQPVDINTTKEGRANNRRTEITINN